jgi:hypothetical protein
MLLYALSSVILGSAFSVAILFHRDLEIEDYIIALNNDWQKIEVRT